MNRVTLVGRTTVEPEIKIAQSGTGICNFTLAVTRKFKNSEGVYESDFINCVAFGKTAELISDYIKKGDMLGVDGRIQTRNYENSEGKKVYITEVVVDQMDFLQSKKKEVAEVEEKPVEAPVEEPEVDLYKEFSDSIEIDENDLPF